MKPADILALGNKIGRHGELASVIFAVMIHPLMANAAFHRDQIEIDTFRLYCAVPQGLQIIVFVARDCQFQFGHSLNSFLVV